MRTRERYYCGLSWADLITTTMAVPGTGRERRDPRDSRRGDGRGLHGGILLILLFYYFNSTSLRRLFSVDIDLVGLSSRISDAIKRSWEGWWSKGIDESAIRADGRMDGKAWMDGWLE